MSDTWTIDPYTLNGLGGGTGGGVDAGTWDTPIGYTPGTPADTSGKKWDATAGKWVDDASWQKGLTAAAGALGKSGLGGGGSAGGSAAGMGPGPPGTAAYHGAQSQGLAAIIQLLMQRDNALFPQAVSAIPPKGLLNV